VFALSIALTAQLPPAEQQIGKPKPAPNSGPTKTEAQPPPVLIPPDPIPYTGEEARENAQENIAIQRDVARSTARVAEDTQRLADYTFLLIAVGAMVGLGQILITIFQLRYTAKAANTAENALKIAERAYLSIGSWELKEFQPDAVPDIRCLMSNNGRTPAKIMERRMARLIGEQLPTLPLAQYAVNKDNGMQIPAQDISLSSSIDPTLFPRLNTKLFLPVG
jgi:hypothetical protein